MPHSYQWVVSQIGARQHYGIPRGFEFMGRLRRLYTDAWYPASLRWMLPIANRPLRAFGGRWHAQVPQDKVVHYSVHGIADALRIAWRGIPTIEQYYNEHLRIGVHFDRRVAEDLARPGQIEPGRDAFFSFNTGALETLQAMRVRGIRTVLDQIDPAKVHEDLVVAEAEKWPGWEPMPGRAPSAYWERMAAEWNEADIILVNSRWSRDALVKQRVPEAKIIIVPIGYETEGGTTLPRRNESRTLTVLWLGTVGLGKGIPYLIEAARQLRDRNIRFIVAGPIGISPQAIASAPSNMSFKGRVTRDQAGQLYEQADVFALPTISDGFAITQLEAMSKGLPVIATPNCGEVVNHGKNGFIVPAFDAAALATAIANLDGDRQLLTEMSRNALMRANEFEIPTNTRQIEYEVRAWENLH